MSLQVVILAGGQGKRMYTSMPKVLHPLGGKPLLSRILETILPLCTERKPMVIFGMQGAEIQKNLASYPIHWIEQLQPLGTAHAAQQALPHIAPTDQVLILCGDVPLITLETLQKLIQETPHNTLGLITVEANDPAGYGRIKRNAEQQIVGIVEEKEANAKEKLITEINPSIYCLPGKYLQRWLPKLHNRNVQQEYYLTDIVAEAVRDGIPIQATKPLFKEEVLGINDCQDLARLERVWQNRIAQKLLKQGVILLDPARIDVRGNVRVERDVIIDVNVILEGEVHIGAGCKIGPNVILRNVRLGNGVEVKANSMLEATEVGDNCIVGPFARLRPDTYLARNVRIGNFVEIKASSIGEATKINHLSYIGDAEVGRAVNIGAGTITCNYNGVTKKQTIIGDNVFIGSDTQLVAPVIIGEGATIGAGSTITENAPAQTLTLARARQLTIPEWRRDKINET